MEPCKTSPRLNMRWHLPRLRLSLAQLRREEGGQVLVILAISVTVLLGMTALAVDGGNLFTERRHFQSAADAGALAGAWELDPEGPSSANQQEAKQQAISIVHEYDASLDVTVEVDADALLVRVTVQRPVKTSFARIMGVDEVSVGATAAAVKTPVLNPTEGILPVGYKDPRYDKDGIVYPEWDDGSGNALAPENWHDLFEDDILEPVPGQQYLYLRAPAGGQETGNFYPLNFEPWHQFDPCEEFGPRGSDLYRCQLNHGGWLQDPENPDVFTLTEPGNMTNPTFKGVENMFATADAQPCTVDDVIGPNDAEAGVYGTDSRDIPSDCARLATVPLLRETGAGRSDPVPISGWLRMAIINVCNSLSANPLDHTSCKQSGQPAIMYAKMIEPAIIQGTPGPSNGRSNMVTVRLVE